MASRGMLDLPRLCQFGPPSSPVVPPARGTALVSQLKKEESQVFQPVT